MNYLPILIIALLYFRGGKFNFEMIPPIISLFNNMPRFDLNELLSGNVDLTAFAPIIESVSQLMEISQTAKPTSNEFSSSEPNGVNPIESFAGEKITYSIDNYFAEV